MASARISLPELDVLRGLAAVCMVVNHAGYGLLSSEIVPMPIPDWVLFISGFAPTLFFFITGVGYGLMPDGIRDTNQFGFLRKVVILLAADALLWLMPGQWIGIDFLGFIAVSMLFLELIRRTTHARIVALLLLVTTLFARFAMVPALRASSPDPQWLHFLIGDHAIKGFSYVPCPWLAFPFAGFLFGRYVRDHRAEPSDRFRMAIHCCWVGLITVLVAVLLKQAGANFYRWRLMTLGYFVASVAMILATYALCTFASKNRIICNGISLRGLRSLAIVPIHYLLVLLTSLIVGSKSSHFVSYLVATTVIIVVTFYLSAILERLSKEVERGSSSGLIWTVSFAAYVCCLALVLGCGMSDSFGSQAMRYSVQVLLCFLLAAPFPAWRQIAGVEIST